MTNHLQINDVAPCIHYECDGVQAAFAFPFAVFRAADLEVWCDGVRIGTGFSVSGAGISTGGAVLFATPPAQGARLTLRRRVALERVSDFQTDGIIRAKTLNDELDYQVAAVQQVADDVARCVHRPFTSHSTADLTLPEPVAGRAIKWGADGLSLVNSDYDPDQYAQVAAMAATQASADRAAIVGDRQAVADDRAASQTYCDQARLYRDQAQASVGGVRVTANDQSPATLAAKVEAVGPLSATLVNSGANETLRLSLGGNGLRIRLSDLDLCVQAATALSLFNLAR